MSGTTTTTPTPPSVMVTMPDGTEKPTPLDDADCAKIGKLVEQRYIPPTPPEKTTAELVAESRASAAAQAAKDPPDKDTQGQPPAH